MADTCHYTFVQTHITHNTKVNCNANNIFWVATVCLGRFISCNKGNTSGAGGGFIMKETVWRSTGNVFSLQFCCE